MMEDTVMDLCHVLTEDLKLLTDPVQVAARAIPPKVELFVNGCTGDGVPESPNNYRVDATINGVNFSM